MIWARVEKVTIVDFEVDLGVVGGCRIVVSCFGSVVMVELVELLPLPLFTWSSLSVARALVEDSIDASGVVAFEGAYFAAAACSSVASSAEALR